jgi:hypothetical protein
MRIKLYENFIDKLRNKKKVRQDLEDIFVELGDVGYSVKVNVLPYDITPNTHYEVILISGTVRNSVIDFNEVSEYFMMLKDYLTDYEYYNMKFHSWSLGHSKYRIDKEFDEIEKNRIEEFGEWSNMRWNHLAIGLKISLFIKI